ncbi:carboxymuconolactone decarboxylase family protein [Puia sp. P3]|uniref:carboxymuconolactone decarboxylase family protein n=1 Tax=Puia sp. P3 TaxID=3423952 RepID=UPI003D66AAE1
MKQRLNVMEKRTNAVNGLAQIGKFLIQSPLENRILDLVYMRASQINGCAMCMEIHSKDLLAEGEDPQRIFLLDAWREAPFYSEKERAALAYTEALTRLEGSQVSDEVYDALKRHFSDEEIVDLTMGIVAINGFNRINIAFGAPIGTYTVGQFR